ncbi:M48 family metallopeptidase [Mycoplasma procyoni]|uniref:M48 family metallopeptidase n=1 Tax=Mycoplasma procyoni TaxID=568784 RepID=UPI00197B1FF3|nr:M48 family metallopeptidase [Mycoplasma procyoni]MBN3534470.1 DUF45 domain-containing protein [Mycoplasma procyoni]
MQKLQIEIEDKVVEVIFSVKNTKYSKIKVKQGIVEIIWNKQLTQQEIKILIESEWQQISQYIYNSQKEKKYIVNTEESYITIFGKKIEYKLHKLDPKKHEYMLFAPGFFLKFESKTARGIKNNIYEAMLLKLENYIKTRVEEIKKEMEIDWDYSVIIGLFRNVWGSNSKGKINVLRFHSNLLPMSKEIIDSVIYHELSHHFYRNHKKSFYNLLLKYCPNYHELTKELNKERFEKWK